ncbi:ribonuclease Z [Geomonas subterranea]|uniref:Ribonuclease Z n=1 Tax=Geomonas subterranea TaxID=2847989 RepID=A0ABX8LJN7_9BACT|nr:MBL fold metallo-hydrolase [Geomonas subterranea]QXE89775.1 ribonuclease Z [Geomonas subterranea]QXM08107.1 ribonuclease Z [Geomonas subterranea]
MTPHFLPTLVNPPFGDPGVYVDFQFARRALLFDLGEIHRLGPRKILRLSDVCISHTHIDHFIGFDLMLRIMLGRDMALRLFGPPGILRQVEHRLASYSWNLIQSYPTEFVITVTELHPDGSGVRARFSSRRVFAREDEETLRISDGVILEEENLLLRVAFLEHSIPCLAYSFEEKLHVNFMKNHLVELGLPVGPWLSEVKRAVLRGEADDTVVTASLPDGSEGRRLTIGELKEKVLQVVPGEKIAYVTDTAFTPDNRRRIVELARGADYFFIEAVFLDVDAERARERAHLTARQAGQLAREAGAARVIPFHFSPRHLGAEDELRREVAEAFAGVQGSL